MSSGTAERSGRRNARSGLSIATNIKRDSRRHQSCSSEGGTTAGEFPRNLCGRSLIDARPQTGTAPDEKTEMRYPTRASELVHRRLGFRPLLCTIHRYNTSRRVRVGFRITVRFVLDGGHQRFLTIHVRCSELTLCANFRPEHVQHTCGLKCQTERRSKVVKLAASWDAGIAPNASSRRKEQRVTPLRPSEILSANRPCSSARALALQHSDFSTLRRTRQSPQFGTLSWR